MVLNRKSHSLSSLPLGHFVPIPPAFPKHLVVPLPRKVYLKPNNSAKNNKNKFLMAFCSLWTAVVFLRPNHCGPTKEHLCDHFNPYKYILLRDFELCHLVDGDDFPILFGCVVSVVNQEVGPEFGKFQVEWWHPI